MPARLTLKMRGSGAGEAARARAAAPGRWGREGSMCAGRFSMTRSQTGRAMDSSAVGSEEEAFADEIARLNGMLSAGLSFRLAAVDHVAYLEPPPPGGPSFRAAPLVASGVLVHGRRDGALRVASRPVMLAPKRRDRLLALASCLAECAMDLGLGTGVYGPSLRAGPWSR